MSKEQINVEEGFELVQTKVPTHVKQLLDILAKQRGMSTYELLQLLRDRDTMEQVRMSIDELVAHFQNKF